MQTFICIETALWLQSIIGVLARKNVHILPYGRPRSNVLLDPTAVLMQKGALSAFLVSFNKRVFLLLSLHPKGADSEGGLHCTQNLRLLLHFVSMIWWWTRRRLQHQARAIVAMSSDFRETRLVFPRERNMYYVVLFIIATTIAAAVAIDVVLHGDEMVMNWWWWWWWWWSCLGCNVEQVVVPCCVGS